MVKNIVLVFVMMVSASTLFAKNGKHIVHKSKSSVEITGKIIDSATGEELTGVEVKCNNQTVYTDFNGVYTLKNMQLGKQVLNISCVAYASIKKEVVIDGSSTHHNCSLKGIE